MRLKNINEINSFLRIADQCDGAVYLASDKGDRIYLKSRMCQYVAIGALLGEHGDELELFCENKDDEAKFVGFFYIDDCGTSADGTKEECETSTTAGFMIKDYASAFDDQQCIGQISIEAYMNNMPTTEVIQ